MPPAPDSSPAPRRRLFFALWPDAAQRAALAALAEGLELGRRARPVPPCRLHVTLAFLGATGPQRMCCAERVAAGLRAPAFTLCLEQLGCWPRARILWSAPRRTPAALSALVAALQAGLADCGFPPERRRYRAHVTLAREVGARIARAPHPPLAWPVRGFHLVESVSDAAGSRYARLRSWELVGEPS